MSRSQRQPSPPLDLERARRALLRYQPASNWVSASLDPTPRMTVGLGFGLSRPDAPEMLTAVGLDPAAVRSGRTPVSDAQMSRLFDLTLSAAIEWSRQRIAGFEDMPPEHQCALLELIIWLGPDGAETVSRELGERSERLTSEPPGRSPWFDRPADPGPA